MTHPSSFILLPSVALLALSGCGTRTDDEWTRQLRAVRDGAATEILVQRQVIEDRQLAELAGLDQLTTLAIDSGRVTDDGVLAMGDLPRLSHVKLAASPIGDRGLRHLATLPALERVNVPAGEFTNDGLAALCQVPKLWQLRIGSPHVTDAGVARIAQLEKLRFLHLINVPLTDDGLKALRGMRQLESLYLDGAQVSDQAIHELLQALPNVHFHIDQLHHPTDPARDKHKH